MTYLNYLRAVSVDFLTSLIQQIAQMAREIKLAQIDPIDTHNIMDGNNLTEVRIES